MFAACTKRLAVAAGIFLAGGIAQAQGLILTEICDGTLTNGQPKWVEITNIGAAPIPDLSQYSIGNFNNGSTNLGGGAATQLNPVPLNPGQSYVYAYDAAGGTTFQSVYGFAPDQFAGGGFINGDDAIALYLGLATGTGANAQLLDVYGVIGQDGTGQVWEYLDSYAIRCWGDRGPQMDPNQWMFFGPDALEHPAGDAIETIKHQENTTPGRHTGCYFGGLPHRALGQSQLNLDPSGNLVISNIGSSGLDGVSVDLGEGSEGALVDGEMLLPGALPTGATGESRSLGTIGGVPDQDLGGVRIDVDPNDLIVTPDVSPLGTQTYTLELYDNDVLVFSQSGLVGPAYRTPKIGWPPRFRMYCRWERTQNFPFFRLRWCCRWFVPRPLTIPGGPTIQATGMDILPDLNAAAPPVESISRIICRGTILPPILVTRSDVYALGLRACAIDGARLRTHPAPAGGDVLTVSNLGSSGCDGVSIDLDDPLIGQQSAGGEMLWEPIDPPGNLLPGSQMTVSASGYVAGVEQVLGHVTILKGPLGGGMDVGVDFAPLGVQTYLGEVYNQGQLVGSASGLLGPCIIPDWPSGCGKRPNWPPFPFPCFWLPLPQPGPIQLPNGLTFVGDELRLLADTYTGQVDGLSNLEVRASDCPKLDLIFLRSIEPPVFTPFCTAKTGLACGIPSIGAIGSSSATSSSGFIVSAAPARTCKSGILLYNQQPNVPGAPFQGGTLCVEPMGLRRAGSTNSQGTPGGGNCDGAFSIDMNAFALNAWVVPDCAGLPSGIPASNPAGFLTNPGTTVNGQYWGRDSLATGSFVSDGLSWIVGP